MPFMKILMEKEQFLPAALISSVWKMRIRLDHPFFRGAASKYIAPQIYLETPNRKILEYTCYDRASERS